MLLYAIHKVILYESFNLLNDSFSYLIQTPERWGVVPATTTLWLLTPTEDMGGFYALILMSAVPLSYLLMRKGGTLPVQQSVAQKRYEISVAAHRMAPFLPELRLKTFCQSGACHLMDHCWIDRLSGSAHSQTLTKKC